VLVVCVLLTIRWPWLGWVFVALSFFEPRMPWRRWVNGSS
jgi:hypothetical protein